MGSKKCKQCGCELKKKGKESYKQFSDKKFCSTKCGARYTTDNGQRKLYEHGHETSLKTREKISKIHKGKKVSKETRLKISLARKGKPSRKSIEALMKYNKENGVWNKGKIGYGKGRKLSANVRRKMSKAQKSYKHWNWIEDRSTIKRNERNDPAYLEWSKAVKDRDGWKCKIDNNDCEGKTVAHHIKPWSKYIDLRYKLNNGITLCKFHHPTTRQGENEMITILENIINNL